MKINAIYALLCGLVTNFNEYFEKLQNHVLHTCTNYVYKDTELCTAYGSYAFNYGYSTQVFTLSTCFLVNKGK